MGLASSSSVPDYGFSWATIGDPGNRPTQQNEVIRAAAFMIDPATEPFPEFGAVDHAYRIRITEVTVGEWIEFVREYIPFHLALTGQPLPSGSLTGPAISTRFGEPFIVVGHRPDEAARMSWEYAARYCNWLHNGKVVELWAFETGVYDTSTFATDADGRSLHQIGHAADALFWIPTRDEWIKAAHYDPDRYGEGRPGYWTYADGSNTRPVGNLLPEDGGERNAGYLDAFPLDVGSFPNVTSPWGLLDCAGGVEEKTETPAPNCNPRDLPACQGSRVLMSTSFADWNPTDIWGPEEDPLNADRIEFMRTASVAGPIGGLRLASVTLCPADAAVPYGILDLADIDGFVTGYIDRAEVADLAAPFGEWDFNDVQGFIDLLGSRCEW